ncbi:MAG: vWA domain-containing protein [Myxococcota bacterium]
MRWFALAGLAVISSSQLGCENPRVGSLRHAKPGIELVECGHQSATVSGLTDVAVMLVMDRSSSMARNGKWLQTQAAVEVALARYDAVIRFGLLMYPQVAGQCSVVAQPDVPLAYHTGALIADVARASDTLRGTPTGAALRAAGVLLRSDAPDADRRVVVLATDGQPTCPADCSSCTGDDEGDCVDGVCGQCGDDYACARAEALDAAGDLADSGIPTYVVGIEGSSEAADVLDAIARMGGTALPTGDGGPAYYATQNGDEVAQALMRIALGVDGCSAPLAPFDGPFVRMDVSIDGQPVAADPHDGYGLTDGGLRLFGASCLAAVGQRSVTVTWWCEPPRAE